MKLDHFIDTGKAHECAYAMISALANKPALPVAQAIARDAVKAHVLKQLRAYVEFDINDIWNGHVGVFGHGAEGWPREEWDEWEETLIEALETYFDGLPRELTSVTFRTTLDRRCPRTETDVRKLVDDFAQEAWRNLTTHHARDDETTFGKEKTAAQVLSSVGITTPDIKGWIETVNVQPEAKEEAVMYDQDALIAEIRESAEMFGTSDKDLHFALDNASDDDDNLARTGFTALGLDYEEGKAQTLQMLRMMGGVDHMLALVRGTGDGGGAGDVQTAVSPEAVTETVDVLPPAAEPPKKERKAKAAPAAPGTVEAGIVPAMVLATLKDKTGVKAEELALGVGSSRTTFINYAAGKAKLVASDANKAYIKKVLDEHILALNAARQLMDTV